MVPVANIRDDPCTSRDGKPKERWPNAESAWFVVELVAAGKHRNMKRGKKAYAYLCRKCDGYHLASCRNHADRKRHKRGLEELHRRLAKKKNPHVAKNNLHDEEEHLTDLGEQV